MSNSISLKSSKEIRFMERANQMVSDVLSLVSKSCSPGVTTLELDRIAEQYCIDHNAAPAFKGYRGFPASLCVSINDQVVHGIPDQKTVLKDGDIVSIDFGVKYEGYYGDAAVTVAVGEITPVNKKLISVTRQSLLEGIAQAVVGNRVSDISAAVQRCAEDNGFSVVRQFVGHGIGRHLHEAPEVPNYVRKGRSPRLHAGMVLAIEPMVNVGTSDVKVLKDGWTVVTTDGRNSAHFEHSVLITDNGPEILSCSND